MKTHLTLPPKTAALLAEHPDALRDVLLRLAQRGLDAVRGCLANKLVPLSDFETCAARDYADSPSRVAAVKRHGNRMLTAVKEAGNLAASANSLSQLAAAQGIKHPIFAELVTTANQTARMAVKLNEAWQSERERILQAEELEKFRFGLAVALVRRAVKGTDAAAVEIDAA